ncbi:MAG: hypothetical protein IJL98_06345 [Lachnospiraceae bacterium]|nr:hypothetical protein [Lachnospiraceae bacterium]
MNDREQEARALHRKGYSCAGAVYKAYADLNTKGSGAPVPRSEGGKCGAVLSAEKILKELGLSEKTAEFDQAFLQEFGSLKCRDLLKGSRTCNDCVGCAAGILKALTE